MQTRTTGRVPCAPCDGVCEESQPPPGERAHGAFAAARHDVVGILSEKDCFRAAFTNSYYEEPSGPVSQYMSRPVETLDADRDIVEVVERFFRSRYRRFPVRAGNQLVGQSTRRDVVRAVEELW